MTSAFSPKWRDIEGLGRFDDPATANAGGPDYVVSVANTSSFAATGTAKNWRSDDNYWPQPLGFNFPLYGINYAPGQNTVVLGLGAGVTNLVTGKYRVTAFGTVNTSLYDLDTQSPSAPLHRRAGLGSTRSMV